MAAIAPPQQGIALNHILFFCSIILYCIDNNNFIMIIKIILPLLIIDINESCRPPVLGGEMRCEGEHRTPSGGDTVPHVTCHRTPRPVSSHQQCLKEGGGHDDHQVINYLDFSVSKGILGRHALAFLPFVVSMAILLSMAANNSFLSPFCQKDTVNDRKCP